ncbi:hypothetical protein [Streptomyces niveus]|uniref:hypothetical protein n=1 Tax=Streptomyces niveus TaxID=193462 RepID=UPI00341FC4AF
MSVDPETAEERAGHLGRAWLSPVDEYHLAIPWDGPLPNLAGIPPVEVPAALRGPNYRRTHA